jgi:hypothetical protein
MNNRLISALAACALVWLSGCALKATVTDFTESRTEIEGVSLGRNNVVILYDGAGMRQVKIADLARIAIFPMDTRTINGRLFFMAEVVFRKSGAVLGVSTLDTGVKNRVFISVEEELRGKTEGGAYAISLDRIAEVKFSR